MCVCWFLLLFGVFLRCEHANSCVEVFNVRYKFLSFVRSLTFFSLDLLSACVHVVSVQADLF